MDQVYLKQYWQDMDPVDIEFPPSAEAATCVPPPKDAFDDTLPEAPQDYTPAPQKVDLVKIGESIRRLRQYAYIRWLMRR